MINKKSIRFYNDHKVRAIWSEEENKWYFSATDIIAAINDEQDYVKAGNYWRWLKKKLASQGIQPVSATHDFKFQAPDGKMRKSDVLDFEGVEMVAKNFPNTRATAFLDWLTTRITTKNKVNLNTHISAFSCIFLPCKSLDLRGVLGNSQESPKRDTC